MPAQSSPPLILFDVDGVLIQPGGYRASVRAAANVLANQLCLGDLALDDAALGIFEAQGITCEWDMLPLVLAIALEQAAACAPELPLESLPAAQTWLRANPRALPGIDFARHIRGLGRFLVQGEAASDAILAACACGACDIFPRLSGQGLLRDLLSHTRRPAQSATTALFETLALGDQVYEKALGLPAPLRSESLLQKYDRSLLRPDLRDRLNTLCAQDAVRIAAYTARPSLPVSGQSGGLAVFAPEAEMALDLVGFTQIQLVGSGQTGEAAQALGEQEDRLTKPAPYHAAAAIAAAWTGDRAAGLCWAQDLFRHIERSGLPPNLSVLPEQLTLHIFEDSPVGMIGGIHAARLLEPLGVHITLHCWGVTMHPEKAAALQQAGAQVFADVNAALEHALFA